MQLSCISIKQVTKIVAYASLLKAILPIVNFFIYGWFDERFIIETAVWITISVFFFTLHKNMQ